MRWRGATRALVDGRRAGRLVALAAAAMLACGPARAEAAWEYAQFPDAESGSVRHTVQIKIDYQGAVAALAFVCVRGNLVLTVVATWPIAPVLRFRFPPESPQWIMGRAPVPSSAVFQGEQVRKLFATALLRQALLVRIPGPRTVIEKTLDLQSFREKAKPLVEACKIADGG